MKRDMDKVILESRNEIELLQNIVEIAYTSGKCNDVEKKICKELSTLLESMYISW